MLSKRSFRILVITDLLLVALSLVVDIVSDPSLPELLRVYKQTQAVADTTPRDWVVIGVGIPSIIVLIVASIGVMVFWRPARPLYLVTVIVGILMTPVGGPYVSSGWVQAIDDASLTITGVVLAVIYFSPLADLYEKPKSAA